MADLATIARPYAEALFQSAGAAGAQASTAQMTALAHDYLDLDSLFTAEELALRERVRAFVRERITPNIAAVASAATV